MYQYGWKYDTGSNVGSSKGLPFPFKYEGVEFDLSNYPFKILYSHPDSTDRLYRLVVYPTQSIAITLGYGGYNPFIGYPLLIHEGGSGNVETVSIAGKYYIPKLVNAQYDHPLSTIIVNFTVDGVPKRYFALCGGQPWTRRNPSSPQNLNKYTFGWAYEYPELTSSSIIEPLDYELATQDLSSSVVKEHLAGKIIDFGQVGQIVPKWFKDWFISVFESATPKISLSILSPDGSTTRLTRTLPQVTKYQASQSGGSQYFTFNSADGSFQNASYEIPTITGKKLVGYSTQPNSLLPELPAVTDGKIDVNWDSDTVLYEVWGRAAPVPDTAFSINLYKSSAERKRVNKADYLTTVGTISGALRDACSVQSPTILLEYAKFPDFNYVYIPAFGGRYYFVENVVSAGKNLWNISFTEDVLMSFKTGILKLSAVIERQENDYNLYLRDLKMPCSAQPKITILNFTGGNADLFFDKPQDGDYGVPFVLTTFG